MDVQPIAELRAVTKRYGVVTAARGLNLTIRQGEFLSFLGPSGCGKTTALRMLAGFEQATEGEVLIDGRVVNGVPPHLRPVNMVFQQYALFPHMNVARNVGYGLDQRRPRPPGAEIAQEVERALQMVRLAGFGDRRIWEMSGGQQQRVALARAIVNRPKILLLDEPMAALDKKLRHDMQIELKSLQRELGITFVLVTHDQEEALVMSDRIAVMFEGEIAQLDGPEALYARPATRRVADFIGVMNFLPARILGEQAGTATVEVPGLGVVDLPERQISRANPDDEGPTIGFRPETMTLVGPTQTHSQPRETNATIDEVVYYGDMTYYDLRLDGAAAMDGKARPVRISMRNVFGRDVQEVGTRTRLAWSPGSLVLFQ